MDSPGDGLRSIDVTCDQPHLGKAEVEVEVGWLRVEVDWLVEFLVAVKMVDWNSGKKCSIGDVYSQRDPDLI